MAYYIFKNDTGLESSQIWDNLNKGLTNDVVIKSIRDKIPYTINYITENEISLSAMSRNQGNAEIITKEDFIKIISGLREMKVFNTSTSVPLFKKTKIYRKRSLIFALLLSMGIIEESFN